MASSTFVPIWTCFSTSETKPWSLPGTYPTKTENSLIIFVGYVPGSCWIDAGYWLGYRTWRNEESWDENFGGCAVFRHMCWFAEKKKQLFFTLNFCFLRARASTAFNFLPSSLSLAKSSDILELCSSLREDFSTIFISLFLF